MGAYFVDRVARMLTVARDLSVRATLGGLMLINFAIFRLVFLILFLVRCCIMRIFVLLNIFIIGGANLDIILVVVNYCFKRRRIRLWRFRAAAKLFR
jgi:hypothetical protein